MSNRNSSTDTVYALHGTSHVSTDGVYGCVEQLSKNGISGWACVVDEKPIYVTLLLDGVDIGGTIANNDRSDVSDLRPFLPAKCGFALDVDMQPILSSCQTFEELKTRLKVTVAERADLELLFDDPFSQDKAEETRRVELRGHLDEIRDGAALGWCVDLASDDIVAIHLFIDGILQKSIDCSEYRHDIATAVGTNVGGFSFQIPSKFYDGRRHEIRCHIPLHGIDLLGSPLEFRFETEAVAAGSEVRTFCEAYSRIGKELDEIRRSFVQYSLRKGAYLANYRFLRSSLTTGSMTRSRLKRKAHEGGRDDVLSIVLPAYKSDLTFLAAAIDSVTAQTDPHWELVISDSASSDGALKSYLESKALEDSRIKVVFNTEKLGIAENTNQALRAATGSIIGFLDHDDTLAPEAVSLMREAFATGKYDLVYSDEDKIDEDGDHTDPHFKSAANLDLLLTMNYICHFLCIRRSALEKTAYSRSEFDGAQDWDLILQVIAAIGMKRVGHIPRILYHWRMTSQSTASSLNNKSYALDAGIGAVNAFLRKMEHPAHAVRAANNLPYAEVIWEPSVDARLSIIIPTRDKLDLVMHCIASLQATIGQVDYEIIIVNNASSARSLKGFLRLAEHDSRIRVVNYGGAFNFSAINNYAVKHASHENILLLNNDVFFVDNSWCQKMLGLAQRADVGAVGLKLLYPDNTVQHCGVILGNGGIAGHAFSNLDDQDLGFFSRAVSDQQVSAVTAACLLIRKQVFEEIGGFETEGLSVAFNDIDLCMRIQALGYNNVLVASRFAYHAESKSRGSEDTPAKVERFNQEIAFMTRRWGKALKQDRYYSPNLDLRHAPFQIIDVDYIIEQEFALENGSIAR